MGSDGFVPLSEVLKKSRVKQIDMEPDSGLFTKDGKKKRREPGVQDVLAIIAAPGEKVRFEVKETESESGHWLIRAIQGHTITAVTDLDHTPISLNNLHVLDFRPPGEQTDATKSTSRATPSLPEGVEILHGTTLDAWNKIKESGGLSRMKRNHIHLARGRPGTPGVGSGKSRQMAHSFLRVDLIRRTHLPHPSKSPELSGSRINSPLLVHVDLIQGLRDGVPFVLASNGAVLTAGIDDSGVLPLRYITKVEDKQGSLIWQQGSS